MGSIIQKFLGAFLPKREKNNKTHVPLLWLSLKPQKIGYPLQKRHSHETVLCKSSDSNPLGPMKNRVKHPCASSKLASCGLRRIFETFDPDEPPTPQPEGCKTSQGCKESNHDKQREAGVYVGMNDIWEWFLWCRL